METNTFLQNLSSVLIPSAVLLTVVVFGFVLRRIVFRKLIQLSRNTASPIDDIIIESVSGPFIIWFVMLGVYLGVELSKAPDEVALMVGKILFVLGAFSIMIVLANISTKLIKTYSRQIESTMPITSLTGNISRIAIYIIGILIILNSLGISITPILATLGVGSLAVALALQDTLSNLFSGFHIIIGKQIRIGDYVKLETGEEGYVTDITWRTTTIRMLPNNMVLIPNEKLTKTILTNYYMPDKEMAVLVNLGVHYDSDLKKVEKVTCETAKEVMRKIPGGIPEFDPFIRYHTFGDFSINFTVIMRVKEFVDQYLVKHEFVKMLHERYKKEGIIIPYPIRTLEGGIKMGEK